MHRPLFMPLDLSCAIYVDYSGSSFATFLSLVAPHDARPQPPRARLWRLLVTLDFPLPSLEHFSLRMSECSFIDDSRDGILPP